MAAKKSKKKNSNKKSVSSVSKAVKNVVSAIKTTTSKASSTASSSGRSSVGSAVKQVAKTAKSTATSTKKNSKPAALKSTKLKTTTFKTNNTAKSDYTNFKKDAKAGKFGNNVKNTLNNGNKGKSSKRKKSNYYTVGNNNVASLLKTSNTVVGAGETAKNYAKAVRDYESQYGTLSEQARKQLRKDYTDNAKKAIDKANKAVQRQYGERKVKVDKLTKEENEAYSKAKIHGTVRGRRLPAAAQRSGNTTSEEKYLKENPDVAKKLAKQQVADYEKHPRLYGLAEGALPVNVDNKKLRKYYSDEQANAIDKAKNTKDYKAAYAVGTIGSFFAGGGGGAIESGIKTGLKGVMKVGTKKVVKEASKDAVETATKKELKNIVKKSLKGDVKKTVEKELKEKGKSAVLDKITDNTWKSLKLTGKDKAKSFIASRAADAAVSTPFNIADALKQSTNAKGETDYKEAAKAFGLNTATDMAIGGVVDGASILSRGGTYKKLTQIMGKRNMGQALTADEINFYNKTMEKVRAENASRREVKAVSKLNADYKDTGVLTTKLADNVKGVNDSVNVKADSSKVSKAAKSKKFSVSDEAVQAYKSAEPEMTGVDGAKSSYVKSNDVPDNLKKTYSEFIDSVDPKIKNAVQNLREGKPAGAKAFDVTEVTPKEADVIMKKLGLDVSGYRHTVEADRLLHIDREHGIIGLSNKNMANANDVARMGWVIRNADDIEIVEKPSGELNRTVRYRQSNGELAPVAVFRKRINGDVVVVEAIPDAKAKELRVASMYFDTIKKGDSKVPDAKSPRLTSENASSLTPLSKDSINEAEAKVNLKKQVDELRGAGKSDDEILETLQKQGVNPVEALEAVDDEIAEDFIAQAAKAGDSKYTTQFDTAREKIKYDNPTPKEHLTRATERISPEEVPHARQTAVKYANQVDDDVAEIVEPWVREGLLDKKILETQKEAIKQAEKEAESGSLFEKFLEMDYLENEHLFMARAQVLLDRLSKEAVNDDDAAKALLQVIDKATDASSHAGRMLNATKLLLRTTPEGRLRIANKEALKLQEKYADRLGDKSIVLNEEQIQKILNANDDNITDVMEEINLELWDNIPATLFEKWNEIRHFSMLANPKTHIRNVVGNTAFKMCRTMADVVEIGIYKIPAVRKRIENLGGSVEMVKISHKDMSRNSKYLQSVFESNYKESGSKQRYIEMTRPDGSPVIRTKWLNALIQKNYAALEWEDVALTLEHEYKKNYVRWAKSKEIPTDGLERMSTKQKLAADAYAMKQAEIATFRDNSSMANAIVRFKEKTATSSNKGLRLANMAIESQLPFVKTPVNVMRRSIDYSPISLLRAMNNLRKVSDVEAMKLGIHQLSTGLTGTGVFLLGMGLAANDFITVNVGKVSGDEYYDRDMGYQDYSLRVRVKGKEYSWTIDWLAPMQTSLFMGANLYEMLQSDGVTTRDIFDGIVKVIDPVLDMSFMSSAKDTMETFMETAFRDGDANYSDAIMNALFGSIPQGYLNSFVPQIFSQTAGLLDDKQRDTRSTKKDPLAKSWESWSRKMINRIPVLREKILNPKIDRFGNDVKTDNNLVMKFVNAYLNPSNVKQIHFTKLDKEIIDIYNHMPEGDDKKFFFYNFTGNPSYELANGKRMSYKDLYKYGKRSRKDQASSIELMTKSESYQNMSYDMKAKEVENAHWNAEMVADRKTYGGKYLIDKTLKNEYSSKTDVAAIKLARSSGAVNDDDLADYMIRKEKLIARCHETDYYTQAIAIALYGDDEIMKIYGVNSDKVDYAREYVTKYGNNAYKMFSDAECNVISGLNKAGASISTKNKAISAADFTINEDTYKAMGIDADTANMGYGIKKFDYSYEALENMKMNAKYNFDSDNSGSLSKAELIDYIESLGIETDEEKAVLFAYFSSAKNPYGGVPNYLGFNGASNGGGGGSSKSRSSKSGKSSSPKGTKDSVPSWEEWVKDYITTGDDLKRVKFKNWDSPIDSSYIKKIQKIIKNKPEAKEE